MSKRAAAVALATKGFKVFLLGTNSKTPVIEDFPARATCDPTKVESAWTDPFGNSRDENIGISTDNLLVMDFDAKAGPIMEREFEAWRSAAKFKHVARTTNGGWHAYFKLPDGVRVANTTRKFGDSIDTRGWHGYVVGPGSDIDSSPYYWCDDPAKGFVPPGRIEDLEFAPSDLIQNSPRAVDGSREKGEDPAVDWDTPAACKAAIEYLRDRAPLAIQGQGGDEQTYKVACRVREFGVSQDVALPMIDEHWNQMKAHPSWPLEELDKKLDNVYRYAKATPHVPGSEYDPVEIDQPQPATKAPTSKKKIQRESFLEATRRAIEHKDQPLVKGLLDCGTLTMLYGASNAGKSFVAIEVGRCVAMGAAFAGRRTDRGSVLYFGLESPKGLRKRFATVCKHKANGKSIPMALCVGNINLFTDKNGEDTKAVIEEIADYERETGAPAKLVIFDTLVRMASGADENGVQDMGPVMERAEAIVNATGVCVLIVHHTGKVLSKGIRGSSAIYGSLDSALCVEADEKVPGRSATGNITTEKQRDDEFAPPIPYVLLQKEFDVDAETLEVRNSCIVEFPPPESVARAEDKPVSRVQLESLEAFDTAEERMGIGRWVSLNQLFEAECERCDQKGIGAPPKSTLRMRMRRLAVKHGIESDGDNWRRLLDRQQSVLD